MQTLSNSTGITLIELMVVLAIVAIISGIAIPAYEDYRTTARAGECVNEIAAIKLAQAEFYTQNLTYFSGTGVTDIKTKSNNLYTPSAKAAGAAKNCTYTVQATGCNVAGGNCTGYTITATGAGDLSGKYSHTVTGP